MLSGSSHTQGPLDGSLYATILKSPKSPNSPNSPNFTNLSPIKPLRGSTQNLISPPPEFREFHTLRSNSLPVNSTPNNNNNYQQIKVVETRTTYDKSPSSKNYEETNYSPRNSLQSVRYSPNSQQNSQQQQIRIVETTKNRYNAGENDNFQDQGRESSVRSPLTLSMDSGISSNSKFHFLFFLLFCFHSFLVFYHFFFFCYALFFCIGRVQGSSVSPSSFPSQASPQGL